MKQKSVASNVIYSVLTQFAGLVAPLIISPYIARVFNAGLIGEYSYTLANSSYFVLAECMGFSLYGTLKAAQYRDDKEKLSFLFWELFWLKILLMVVCTVVYAVMFILGSHSNLKSLYIIMLLNIVANGIDITWLLNGLEEFRTVAIRTVIVRIVNVILVLLLVKNEGDLPVYALIMQGSVLASYICVLPMVIGCIKWVSPRKLRLLRHLKPSMAYFVPGLVNTIFSSADKSVLGAFSRNTFEVGVYEQANKICQLCAGLISAVSNAILPRAAYMFHNKKEEDTRGFVIKTVRIAVMFAMPVTFGIAMVSDVFIPWFFGPGYDKSIVLLRILSINVFLTSVGNFISQQCLIARGKQKEYNIAIITGASLNIILNMILVNRYMSVGVSVASSITGLVLFLLILLSSRDTLSFKTLLCISWRYAAGVLGMSFVLVLFRINASNTMKLFLYSAVGAATYFVILLALRDDGFRTFISMIVKKIKHDKA